MFLVSVVQSCCKKLYNCLKVAPYRPDQQVEEDDDLMDESQGKGIRVLGVAFATGRYIFVLSERILHLILNRDASAPYRLLAIWYLICVKVH